MPRRAAALAGRTGEPAELLRGHLLDAAESLLADRRVSAVTTRDLARAAKVSEGVLYNYFADKNELLLTALVRRFVALVERLHAELPDAGAATVAENLERIAAALHALHADALPLFGKLMTEPPLLARFMHEIHSAELPLGGRQIRDPVVAYLEAEQRAGRLGPFDAGAAADLLLGSVALLALARIVGAADDARRIPALVRTLLCGLEERTRP